MPLNRPARRLMPGPQAVAEARRWIVQTLRDIERDDLLETAELAVSELVTNAVLHSLEPISVRVRGTRQHPRVEVHDGSPEPPILPHETSPAAPTEPSVDVVEADLLATFGRGLDIVARCSEAWGADVDLDSRGKVVWFSPAPEVADHEGPRGVVTGVDAGTATDPEGATRPVHLRGLPADLFRALGVQQGALRREVRLLSLAHGDTYPAIHELDQVLAVLDQTLRPLLTDPERVVVDQHAGLLDLQVDVRVDTVDDLRRLVSLLDLADEFCRQQRLLTIARDARLRDFQSWLLAEMAAQASGAEPSLLPGSVASATLEGDQVAG